jgi:hypothetical protein
VISSKATAERNKTKPHPDKMKKAIILPNLKGIIRIGTAGYLKPNGGSYSAYTAGRAFIGDATTFTQAAALVRAA